MILRALLFFLGATGCALSAADTTVYVTAVENPLVGDWRGRSGPVVQAYVPAGGSLRLNVLSSFDQPDTGPLAVLEGEASAPTSSFRGSGGWLAVIDGPTLMLRRGGESWPLQRVSRDSPTLGLPPPAGAKVLFDGTGLDAWAKKAGKNWLAADGPASWKLVSAGKNAAGLVMEVVPGADSLVSHEQFGDCRVHLEFQTLGAPTNSGIYLQARYEVNINESYGLWEGNPNGGLDNCSEVKPAVRASRPPLEWQTLDIEFVAPRFDAVGNKTASARATVRLNGVTLYSAQELNPPKGAAGRLGEAASGPLLLQEHGQPVQFRNIWLDPSPPLKPGPTLSTNSHPLHQTPATP